MAKTNCKQYPTDYAITGAVFPLIFGTLAIIMFVPSFKYKGYVTLVAAIILAVVGYKIGEGIKTTVEICDGD